MPTSWNALYLGNFGIIDTAGGDYDAESASRLTNQSIGSEENPLYNNFVTISPDASKTYNLAGNRAAYDNNADAQRVGSVGSASNIEYFYENGVRRAFDAMQQYHATVVYTDGTTADILAEVFQDWNGRTYLAPSAAQDADQGALEAKPIQSITLGGEVNNGFYALAANRPSWNYKTETAEPVNPEPATDASISGTLYADEDSDAVKDSNEPGLNSVKVELIDADGKVVATTATDANGSYKFDNLAAGDYTVRPETNPNGLAINEGADLSVSLSESEKETGVDAGFSVKVIEACENDTAVQDFDSTCRIVTEDVWFAHGNNEEICAKVDFTGQGIYPSGFVNAGTNALMFTVTLDQPALVDTVVRVALTLDPSEVTPVGGKPIAPEGFAWLTDQGSEINAPHLQYLELTIKQGQTVSEVGYIGVNSAQANYTFGVEVVEIKNGNLDEECSDPAIIATTPVAFDLNGDGIINVTGETTSQDKSGVDNVNATVSFDINGDGTEELIEWLDGSGDGMLVDNRDGLSLSALAADMDGNRLFGDQNGTYNNGYQKLAAQFDKNGDGVVNGTELAGLQIWQDDGDAKLEAGELHQLSEFGVTSISTKVTLEYDSEGRALARSVAETNYEATGQVSYSLEGPDAALFNVDENGNVTFKEAPDYENPLDANGDNNYDITLVRNFANDLDPDCAPERESLRIEVCDKDDEGGTASLGDFVWYDTNKNGLQDAGEAGAAGVIVTLTGAGEDGTVGTADDTTETTTTDANGKYLFDNLDAGDYKVTFGKPNGYEFTTTSNGAADVNANDSDADRNNGMTSIISLSEGEHEPDVDAGLIKKGTASLGDFVWYDTNKNGLQDAGEAGAAGVTVTLTGAGNDGVIGTNDDTTKSTTTDTNGKYLFDNLDAGSYKVTFDKPNGYEFTTTDGGGAGMDANDSDADPETGMTSIVTLTEGEHEPDVDAGLVKEGTASLGDTVWFDTNRNGRQDAGERGAAGVAVTLTGAGLDGSFGTNDDLSLSTVTDSNGKYLFDNLDAGDYKVTFGKPNGYEFTSTDGGDAGADAGDSDADRVTGMTSVISLSEGEHEPDVDAGLVNAGIAPAATDDAGTVCATESKVLDVLANDNGSNGPLGVTSINGQTIAAGGSVALASGAVVSLNADGTLAYNSVNGSYQVDGETISVDDLLIGQKAQDSFSYSITDANGETSMATVDMSVCGAKNTLDTIANSLPEGGIMEISLDNTLDGDFYTAHLSDTGDARFDGKSFDIAYCVAAYENIEIGVEVPYEFYLASESDVPTGVISHPENLDMVNWIMNQDFSSKANGEGGTYTEAEIQGAIWGLTDDIVYVEETNQNYGTTENAQEIYELALANGEGFEAGEGDFVGLILDPTEGPGVTENIQPFIIGIQFDDLAQDCLCG